MDFSVFIWPNIHMCTTVCRVSIPVDLRRFLWPILTVASPRKSTLKGIQILDVSIVSFATSNVNSIGS